MPGNHPHPVVDAMVGDGEKPGVLRGARQKRRAGAIAQWWDACLARMHKALGSTLSTEDKKGRKEKEKRQKT